VTARPERAVRAVPGATSDRRESVGAGQGGEPPDPNPLNLRVRKLSTASDRGIVRPLGTDSNGGSTTLPPPSEKLMAEKKGATRSGAVAGSSELARRLNFQAAGPFSVIYTLEHPGTFEIVLLLDQVGRTNPSRMRQRLLPGPKAIDRALRDLQSTGLIRLVNSVTFPFAKTYELTDRGRALAATMRSWNRILAT